MKTIKTSVVLGTRSYDINVPNSDFLFYLENELNGLKNKDGSIEIPVFLNHYLKKNYLFFKINEELEKLKNEKSVLEEKLKNQELELKHILDRLKEGEI